MKNVLINNFIVLQFKDDKSLVVHLKFNKVDRLKQEKTDYNRYCKISVFTCID